MPGYGAQRLPNLGRSEPGDVSSNALLDGGQYLEDAASRDGAAFPEFELGTFVEVGADQLGRQEFDGDGDALAGPDRPDVRK